MPKRKTHLSLAEATDEQVADMLDGSATEEEVEETDAEMTGNGRGEDRPPKTFCMADPVETMGNLLIKDHYPKLRPQRVLYVYVSEASKSEGKEVIVKPMKIQGLNAWLAQLWDGANESTEGPGDAFFLILVAQTIWEKMDRKSREAVLDEALWQCDVRASGALYVRKLEVRTAVEVVQRHGLYDNKLADLGQVSKKFIDQPTLPVEAAV